MDFKSPTPSQNHVSESQLQALRDLLALAKAYERNAQTPTVRYTIDPTVRYDAVSRRFVSQRHGQTDCVHNGGIPLQ